MIDEDDVLTSWTTGPRDASSHRVSCLNSFAKAKFKLAYVTPLVLLSTLFLSPH